MKDEFLRELEEDEILLYNGRANVDKTSNQLFRFLLSFSVVICFIILSLVLAVNTNILSLNIVILFIILIILAFSLIYGFIYNICLKYKNRDNKYYITNKRIAVYSPKNGIRVGKISDLEHIGIVREKNNYGDIIFTFRGNSLVEQMKNNISFEGAENPRVITEIVSDNNKGIHIYDDRPTIFGDKIKWKNKRKL